MMAAARVETLEGGVPIGEARFSMAGLTLCVGLGLLFLMYHFNFLWRMGSIAWSDDDWSFAFAVPFISLYFVYQNRYRLMEAKSGICVWGLLPMMAGMVGYILAITPVRNDMIQGYCMVLSLFGLVLFMLGPRVMGVVWFPIVYLAVGVKISQSIWGRFAESMQDITVSGADKVLVVVGGLLGMETTRSGNTLTLIYGDFKNPLNVAEACAGLRMLMAFIALGFAMAYGSKRPVWQRWVMAGLAVPVAILVNIMRVTVIGLASTLVHSELAQGQAHIWIGMLMLLPAAGLIWCLGWVMDQMVISDDHAKRGVETKRQKRVVFGGGWARWEGLGGRGLLIAVLLGGLGLLLQGLTVVVRPDVMVYGSTLSGLLGVCGLVVGLRWYGVGGGDGGGVLGTLLPGMMLALGLLGAAFSGIGFGGYLDRFDWASGGLFGIILVVGLIGVLVSLGIFLRLGSKGGWDGLRRAGGGMCAGVLLAGLLGMGFYFNFTEMVLFKKAVPMRVDFTRMAIADDKMVGPWQFMGEDPPLDEATVKELGTTNYFTRRYWKRDEGLDGSWQVGLHVAYYSGGIDTVPHVASRCFSASGAKSVGEQVKTLVIDNASFAPSKAYPGGYEGLTRSGKRVYLPRLKIPVTVYTYRPTVVSADDENVVYFFVSNGRFLETPNKVRASGFDPRDTYAFYSKIEVRLMHVSDPNEAVRRAGIFLSSMLPELMACLPDWNDVRGGRWPLEAKSAAD